MEENIAREESREEITYVHDRAGRLIAVQISAALWEKLKPHLPAEDAVSPGGDDLEAFAEFISAWNFPYAYEPHVRCPSCGVETGNWRTDPLRPFRLKNANIGGLLVFSCQNCGATVRQKFFRTHMACEHTRPQATE